MNATKRVWLWVAPIMALMLVCYASVSFADCGACKHKGSTSKHKGSAPKMEMKEGTAKATVNTATMMALVSSKTKMVILDARAGKWDDGKRIPGAKQLAHDASKSAIKKAVGKNKEMLIITYCGGPQCPLSNKLAERLNKMGYTNVIEYPEGMPGWLEAGGKVEKVKEGSEHKESSGSK